MTKDNSGENFVAFILFIVIASTLTLIILKFTGQIDISWIAATSPAWMAIVVAFSAAIAVFVLEKMTEESKPRNDDLQELEP